AVAHRVRLGPAGNAGRRAGIGGAHRLRTVFRSPPQGNLAGPAADAAVPDLAPLPRRNPAAAGAAAKDPVEHRRSGPAARPGPRSVEHRQAVSRVVDAPAGRSAETYGRAARPGAALRQDTAGPALAAAHLPAAKARRRAARIAGAAGRTEKDQPPAAGPGLRRPRLRRRTDRDAAGGSHPAVLAQSSGPARAESPSFPPQLRL